MSAKQPPTTPEPLEFPNRAETAPVRFLDASGLAFVWANGYLRMEIKNGSSYDKVKVLRSFPLSEPAHYLSVCSAEEKEIGLIRSLSELDKSSRMLVEKELERRYFVPRIERVISTRMQFGFVHWEVETDRGRCRFSTRHLRDNVVRPSPGRYILSDVDNNRFDIPDIAELDPRSQSLLLQQI